eukprot:COSAG02_NODE_3858_length_6134_cov_6.287016_7_plen_61_part_00
MVSPPLPCHAPARGNTHRDRAPCYSSLCGTQAFSSVKRHSAEAAPSLTGAALPLQVEWRS